MKIRNFTALDWPFSISGWQIIDRSDNLLSNPLMNPLGQVFFKAC